MAVHKETVLYYNPGDPETAKHVALMKSVLVRMGIRIRNVGPDQIHETVGYLAGLEGYPSREEAKGMLDRQEDGVTEGHRTEDHWTEAEASLAIPVEVMVLKQFSDRRLDELLMNLRRAKVPRIRLKAVLTEHNSHWSFYQLYEELWKEHQAMEKGEDRNQ